MQLPILDHAFFLQALGWAILNSFWQFGILWMFYRLLTVDKNLSSQIKHHLSFALLNVSLLWFLVTIIQNYRLLASAVSSPEESFLTISFIFQFQLLNPALPFLSVFYFLILSIYVTRFIQQLTRNQMMQQSGFSKAPVDYRLFTEQTAIHLGIKTKVEVWISALVDVPSVTGFIKPMILLPAAIINQLSLKQVEAILLHELAHIKRNDYFLNILQSVIELVLFFNPFVFLLGRASRQERENCCDDWVLNYRYDKHDYARALLILEEQRSLALNFALAATNNKKDLLQRIKRLFNSQPQSFSIFQQQLKLVVLSLLLLVGIFLALPVMKNKHNDHRLLNLTAKKAPKIYLPANPVAAEIKEIPPQQIFASRQVSNASRGKKAASVKPKKQVKTIAANEYVDAYINEELLTLPSIDGSLVSLVVDKATLQEKYFVKIEEQQSGDQHTRTYYLEINNKDGHPGIKPLVVLNKRKVSSGKISPKAQKAKRVSPVIAKKRVTS